MTLQSQMATHLRSPGDLEFNKFRAFRDANRVECEPNRFVDGEFIQKFLDLDERLQDEVVRGLEGGVEGVRAVVEQLRRLH